MDLDIIDRYIRLIEKTTHSYFYFVNRNVTDAEEFCATDIPVDSFPFSKNTEIVHKQYDVASDLFHSLYGRYTANYWEYIAKMPES